MRKTLSINRLVCVFVLGSSFLFASTCSGDDLSALSGKYKDYNVILLTFDAMRPDHLGCYGYTLGTSPTIDGLAEQGIVFENAFSQSSLTIMSVTSLYTSLYPQAHGVRHILKDQLAPKTKTLAQIMNQHGYATGWFGSKKDYQTGAAPGLLKGFHETINLNEKLPTDPIPMSSWIRKHRKKKFFMVLHSYRTHDDGFPFKKYGNHFALQAFSDTRIKLDTIRDLINNLEWKDFESVLKVFEKISGEDWVETNKNTLIKRFENDYQKKFPKQEQKNLLIRFTKKFFLDSLKKEHMPDILTLLDSSILEIDQKIVKELVAELQRNKIFDKTIIIITADHGNEFMEHGHVGHALFVYDESIHIPLIFYLPHLSQSVRVKDLAEGVDIFPTILNLIGIPIPSQAQGVSQVGNGSSQRSASLKDYIISESVTGQLCLRSKKWKLIGVLNSKTNEFDARELFNLENDPKELLNVIKDEHAVAKELQTILLSKLSAMTKYRDVERSFIPTVDEKTRERIIKTGYW